MGPASRNPFVTETVRPRPPKVPFPEIFADCRPAFFKALTRHHPVFPTHTTPIYSNMAYQLLGYALENVTGRPFESLFDETIKGPLNLSRSSYKVPADESQGMIPIGLNQSGWNQDIGDEGP